MKIHSFLIKILNLPLSFITRDRPAAQTVAIVVFHLKHQRARHGEFKIARCPQKCSGARTGAALLCVFIHSVDAARVHRAVDHL